MTIRTILTALCFCLTTTVFAAPPQTTPKNDKTPLPPPSVLSIIPSQGEPGIKINMTGSSFGKETKVFLGSQEVPLVTGNDRQLEFMIPIKLQAGVYALYLQRSDNAISRPYNFTVTPLRPVIKSVAPEQLSSCAMGNEREITVSGQNFSEESQLFFDGVVIPSRLQSPDALTFSAPQVAGGLHQVMVKNAPDNGSAPIGLMIATKPEIDHVTIGNEYVNYYDLIVEGRNFQQNASITVDGSRIGGQGGDDLASREKLIFLGCNKLIYQRHPYSPTTKEFRLQVVNGGGEGSQVVTVSAP